MSITSLNLIPEDMRTSIIYIYSYRDKNPTGMFYNLYYNQEIVFGNLTRLLLLMEDMMDELNYPQASVQGRKFGKLSEDSEQSSVEQQLLQGSDQEIIASFKINVLFRQGASWQGKISWVEGKEEKSFRSVLEMVKLIDSALPQPEVCKQEPGSMFMDVG